MPCISSVLSGCISSTRSVALKRVVSYYRAAVTLLVAEVFIRHFGILLDDLDLLWVVGESAAEAVEVVAPFCEVDMLYGIVAVALVLLPGCLRILVGLILTLNESPLIASYFFKEVEWEDLLELLIEAVEPLGVYRGSVELLELVDKSDIIVVARLAMEGYDIRLLERILLDLGGSAAVFHSAPNVSGERLNRVYLSAYLEELFEVRQAL